VQNPFLIGEEIYLRPLERADAPLFARWINDPSVSRTLAQHRPINLQSEEEFIDRARGDEHSVLLVIVLRDGDRAIGTVGLDSIDFKDRRARFGIVIGEPDHWGLGHGSEATRLILRHAFATLNLHRVWLHVYEYNERGLRCYDRIGFRREGVLRQDHYSEGRYWDVISMGLLRPEWDALQAAAQS
jgi:UDP-4-amino-4,6-dideoxy-N-acetyl-beta-L-altrosamine N-acetyltransferase